MKEIGNSSLWVERYRPKCVEDIVATSNIKKLLASIVESGDLPNLLLYGSAGIGKTTAAKAIAAELEMDHLYINGSLETSVDVIRDRVKQFATTSSLMGGKKVVIMDECDRISANGQDALKVLLEESEGNARFIFCTNNVQKIIPPLHSRCKLVSFNYTSDDAPDIMVQYFKRVKFILTNEGVEFDVNTLRKYITMLYPDFRKTINELQGYVRIHGKVDDGLLAAADASYMGELVGLLKGKKYDSMLKLASEIDPAMFYSNFYAEIRDHLVPQSIPEVILVLADYANRHTQTVDQDVNLAACLTELMMKGQWK